MKRPRADWRENSVVNAVRSICIGYAELHFSITYVRGQPGEPVARLTPLGRTCIGSPKLTEDSVQRQILTWPISFTNKRKN